MKKLIFFFALIFTVASHAQDITDNLTSSVKMGNASQLSELFNESIEIIIDNNDQIYTRQQAQMVMNDFFKKNPPSDFNIAHNSQRDGSRFLIGNYNTRDGKSLRIIFLLREKDGKNLVHQIRIQ